MNDAPADLTRNTERAGHGEATALLEQCVARIGRADGRINAFVALTIDQAHKDAAAADERIAVGKRRGPLDGMVVAVKDNIDVAGAATAAGLQALRERIAASDAEVVRRLRSAGAIIVGKTNMDEAAMGGTTANPFFGLTHNPHQAGYSAGGSSGGSAAAVASGMTISALGTDTLGSTRIPASYCGIAALKPTFGLLSTRGVLPLCHRLDSVGLLASTARDLGPLLQAVAGFDAACPNSRMPPEGAVRWAASPEVGMLAGFWGIEVEPHVHEIFGLARAALVTLGRRVREIAVGEYDPTRARRAGLLLGEADACVTHADILAKQPETLSPEVRSLMTFGRDVAGEKISRAARLVDSAAPAVDHLARGRVHHDPDHAPSAIAHGAPVPRTRATSPRSPTLQAARPFPSRRRCRTGASSASSHPSAVRRTGAPADRAGAGAASPASATSRPVGAETNWRPSSVSKVRLSTGIDCFYKLVGSGPPLLLVPGTSMGHDIWALQEQALAPDYTVISIDPRGAGQSTAPDDPAHYTVRRMADDAAALLDTLTSRPRISPASRSALLSRRSSPVTVLPAP